MSNDRHLIRDDGTMGNVFRRVTLATLGLDSLEDISEESFDVIDRADSFVSRLLGGVSQVMPKIDSENIGIHASAFAERLCTGMNGPKSATDLGDWQYWLDAALLMLFDEEEEEEETSIHAGSQVQTRRANALSVRNRVAALKQSGVTPTMIQSVSPSVKRSLIQELKRSAVSEQKGGTVSEQKGASESEHWLYGNETSHEAIVSKLSQRLISMSDEHHSRGSIDRIFAENSRNSFVSHIAEKAALVSRELSNSPRPEAEGLAERWSESVKRLGTRSHGDMTAVREMLTALNGLEKAGAVSSEQASRLRIASGKYARQIYLNELSRDVSVTAERVQSIINERSSRKSQPISFKAIGFSTATIESGHDESIVRTFAALSEKLDEFSSAVKTRVLNEGETAATVRWSRASDRFSRLNGISDEVDRVLLRDIAESAVALKNAGIVPAQAVDSVLASASEQMKVGTRLLSDISAPKYDNIGIQEVLSHFGASKVLGKYASQIENSVNSLVQEISKAGTAGKKLEGFISDIRQMLSTGSVSGTNSERQTYSVIESICSRLDEFAEMAATNLVTEGYDELALDGTGTFVSTSEESKSGESEINSRGSSFEAVSQIRKQAERTITESKALIKAQLETVLSKAGVSSSERQELNKLSSSSTIEGFVEAQRVLEPHLTSAARSELSQMIESVRRSENHLAEVSNQIKLIETSSKIADNLRKTVNQRRLNSVSAREPQQVQLGDVRLDSSYLSTLSETLNSFVRIRDAYTFTKTNSFVSGMSDGRLERMLSTIKPTDKDSAISNVSSEMIDDLVRSETVVGYDEIIPSVKEWVVQSAHYPSNSKSGDIASVLGAEKAASIHAADFVNGRISSVQALAEAIERSTFKNNLQSEITSYSVSDAGEAIKVSIKAQSGNSGNNNTYELKQIVGQAYNPASIENLANVKESIQAKINVSRQSLSSSVSGVETFVPVIAGANQVNSMSNISLNSDNAGSFEHDMSHSSSDMAKLKTVSSTDMAKLGIISSLSGIRSGIGALPDSETGNEKFRMSVGGVDFELTSNDFVQMVAKPIMMSAAVKQPSLMDASNVLFSGYASLMSERGERRSINTLRKAYLDSLSNASRYSAHSEIGFNTESFTHLMGISSKPSASSRISIEKSDERVSNIASDAGEYEKTSSFASELAETRERTISSDYLDETSYSWVSNQVSPDIRTSMIRMHEAESETSHQYLSRVENMLDYVETLSERNVGVFSTNDTVRVLLEALPSEGELGNKGLPKWRQRDTRAARAAEARELREALAKIGAQPVQGVQRFADRRYVSPNLLQNQETGSAPLFSSGTEGSTTPKATANSSNSGNSQFCSSSIQDEDLQFIAEEVFRKIEDSLNEEHQRRRSE